MKIHLLILSMALLQWKSSSCQTGKDKTRPFYSDTTTIKSKKYVLSVFKTKDSGSYFLIQREQHGTTYKTILRDRNYTTNNSDIKFADCNHDGFDDIVLTKKWQEHAYLFNPKTNNFVAVGEFHNVDTLRVNKKIVRYKNAPVLFLINDEKGSNWMIQRHSELFIIDSNYRKVSFASIDNLSSQDDDKIEKLQSTKSVFINCYIPPYKGRYNDISIWNIGNQFDSFTMKSADFDKRFIERYWQNKYSKLLQYGMMFSVRSKIAIEYF
jgi:hypothetical protein